MKLTVFSIEDGARTEKLFEAADFCVKGQEDSNNAILDAACDVALRSVIMNLYDEGFGISRKDYVDIDERVLTSIISCSGRNVKYAIAENGTMRLIEDKSRPDRMFEVVVDK